MAHNAKADVPRKIKGTTEWQLMCAIKPVRTKRCCGIVIVCSCVYEINVLGGAVWSAREHRKAASSGCLTPRNGLLTLARSEVLQGIVGCAPTGKTASG